MSRPEILFPLFADITGLNGVGARTAEHLAQIEIHKPADLLFQLPRSIIDRRRTGSLADLALPCIGTVEVEVGNHLAPGNRSHPYRVNVRDAQIDFQLVFFHARKDYIQKILPPGSRRIISGKAEAFGNKVQMAHPDFVVPPKQVNEIPNIEPVYALTHGVTQKLMVRMIKQVLNRVPDLAEWIDPELRDRENWPNWLEAVRQAHAPLTLSAITPEAPARRRLAYDEFFAHQLTLAIARARRRRAPGRVVKAMGRLEQKVLDALDYVPTAAQVRAVDEISSDLAAPFRMNRLLQGDVGSGKTLVAFLALLRAVESGGQGALMAPTEILARQHMESLAPLASAAGVMVEVLTGRDRGQHRADILSRLEAGKIDILIGTHAIFQESVAFKDLIVAVIDEQHRFGVRERLKLGAKGSAVDVLVMTATPIPRSLALSLYGDMDVSILDEKPPGRRPISTALVPNTRMDEVVERLRSAIAEGNRAYWVCPLVEESEVSDLTAAQDRFQRLRAKLGDEAVALVHGQMDPAEKDMAMAAFVAGNRPVLVATTVIEVGVDVPEATIMVIERAENFGLAQLHQLRGRVGRGKSASTCLLMYQAPLTEGAERRLTTLRETQDGFKIAETDLEMRGSGDLIGTAQSGLPRFRIADPEHQSGLMATAQTDARRLLESDPELATPRGEAARVLLYLMEQDQAIRLISVG